MRNPAPAAPDSEAQRKARQRAAKRAAGLVEIAVWVAPEQVQALRDFAESLPRPSPPENPTQGHLFGDSLSRR